MKLSKIKPFVRPTPLGEKLCLIALNKRKCDDGLWRCTKCKVPKPKDEFPPNRKMPEYPNSNCFECHRSASSNYYKRVMAETAADRRKASEENRRKRKERYDSKLITCDKCGETKPRGQWPREGGKPNGHLRKYCCSPSKRTKKQIALDIERQAKVCTSCHMLKPFSDFSPHSIAKDGRQKTCKPCRSAKVHSGEWSGNRRREAKIRERSDGSITSDLIKSIFSVQICPCCDGFMERDDKVLDHIIPLKLGGLHSADNVTVMCRTCNGEKSAYHPSRWLLLLREDAADRMREHYAKIGLNFDE